MDKSNLYQLDAKVPVAQALPFAHREHIRIAFNLFAADMDDQHGTGLYFHMESAF